MKSLLQEEGFAEAYFNYNYSKQTKSQNKFKGSFPDELHGAELFFDPLTGRYERMEGRVRAGHGSRAHRRSVAMSIDMPEFDPSLIRQDTIILNQTSYAIIPLKQNCIWRATAFFTKEKWTSCKEVFLKVCRDHKLNEFSALLSHVTHLWPDDENEFLPVLGNSQIFYYFFF